MTEPCKSKSEVLNCKVAQLTSCSFEGNFFLVLLCFISIQSRKLLELTVAMETTEAEGVESEIGEHSEQHAADCHK